MADTSQISDNQDKRYVATIQKDIEGTKWKTELTPAYISLEREI